MSVVVCGDDLCIIFEQEDGQHDGNKRLVSVRTNQIRKLVGHLGLSFFLSRLFDLEVREGLEGVRIRVVKFDAADVEGLEEDGDGREGDSGRHWQPYIPGFKGKLGEVAVTNQEKAKKSSAV